MVISDTLYMKDVIICLLFFPTHPILLIPAELGCPQWKPCTHMKLDFLSHGSRWPCALQHTAPLHTQLHRSTQLSLSLAARTPARQKSSYTVVIFHKAFVCLPCPINFCTSFPLLVKNAQVTTLFILLLPHMTTAHRANPGQKCQDE